MADLVVIALFRHGVTEANKRKQYLGWGDSPLCREFINPISQNNYQYYFSSDLPRCITTSQIMFPRAIPQLMEEFREINFGRWEGKTYEELKDDKRYRKWLLDPEKNSPLDGENISQFSERVKAGWKKVLDQILANQLQSCAIITHGGVIRYLLTKYAPEQKDFWSWHIPHNQGFELIFERETLRRGGRCTLLQEVPLTVNVHG